MENKQDGKLLIYGANGYTGQLICEEAHKQGLTPVLAGRNSEAITQLGTHYMWETRIFSLETIEEIEANLSGIAVVMHAAGPFRFTAHNMMKACLNLGIHYLDISGEIDVFALASGLHQEALNKNIMLMPGTGFDVVPTDCLALSLKEKMPDATSLELAFVTVGGQISHGTAMSMSERIGEGGMYRKNGQLVPEPMGKKKKTLKMDNKEFFVMSIPWGDVFTSYHTTKIGNVRAFTGITPLAYYFLKAQFLYNGILRSQGFKRLMQKRIHQRPAGPTAEKRAKAISYIWGEVTNDKGQKESYWYTCPDGYTVTAITAVDIASRVMAGDWKPGYHTPAGCYGTSLVTQWINK